jgi:hypothetical protein
MALPTAVFTHDETVKVLHDTIMEKMARVKELEPITKKRGWGSNWKKYQKEKENLLVECQLLTKLVKKFNELRDSHQSFQSVYPKGTIEGIIEEFKKTQKITNPLP